MNNVEFWKWFWGFMGPAILALIGWIGSGFKKWLSNKVENDKAKKMLNDITDIIFNAVMCISQSFVSALKKDGKFGPKEQEEAKEKALAIVMSQLTPQLKEYIETNFGDVREYILTKIEAVLWQTKK